MSNSEFKFTTPYKTYIGEGNYEKLAGNTCVKFLLNNTSNLVNDRFIYGKAILEDIVLSYKFPVSYMIICNSNKENLLLCNPFKYNGYVYPHIEYFKYAYSDNELLWELYVDNNIATRELIDRVLLCPKCQAIPTVRPGCPSCGSFNIAADILVHHYACGNVNFLNTFVIDKDQGSITCPKCHKHNLLVNCDYDVTHGLQRCGDCGNTSNSLKMIGKCLVCETQFLTDQAYEMNLYKYSFIEEFRQ
jgi:hypothetical protein